MCVKPCYNWHMIICNLCKIEFEYSRKTRCTKEVCAACMANRHRWNLKTTAVKYKGGCCQLCGYNRCMRALSFHHLDPTKKKFGFGASHNRVGMEQRSRDFEKGM